jgi:hypothetical protein
LELAPQSSRQPLRPTKNIQDCGFRGAGVPPAVFSARRDTTIKTAGATKTGTAAPTELAVAARDAGR